MNKFLDLQLDLHLKNFLFWIESAEMTFSTQKSFCRFFRVFWQFFSAHATIISWSGSKVIAKMRTANVGRFFGRFQTASKMYQLWTFSTISSIHEDQLIHIFFHSEHFFWFFIDFSTEYFRRENWHFWKKTDFKMKNTWTEKMKKIKKLLKNSIYWNFF